MKVSNGQAVQMTSLKGHKMLVGQKYRVQYMPDSRKAEPWEFTGTYLGSNRISGAQQFSLRPLAGTVTVELTQMIAVHPAFMAESVQLPRKM